MSLLKEREYYKPFQYPWAFENYKKQQQMHWLPDEVPLQDDIKDYREKLSDGERTLLDNIFKFFTQADVDVCGGYAHHYLPTFKQPEVRMMLVAYAAMEAVHQEAYSLLLETLGKSEDMYQEFMDINAMMEKHEYLQDFSMETPFDMAKTMAEVDKWLFGGDVMLLRARSEPLFATRASRRHSTRESGGSGLSVAPARVGTMAGLAGVAPGDAADERALLDSSDDEF